jgi:tRNA A37 threonylcarbamoyladenosine modification protein TsaB
MENTVICAIDLSGPFASFAVNCSGKLLCAKSFLLQNRNNSAFFNSFFETLKNNNILPNLIDTWIVGTGPGSFTGLRIASSFVLGAAYQSKKFLLGIPSAFPLASALNLKPEETAGILFPCSKDMIFLYGIKNENGYGLKKLEDIKIITVKEIRKLDNYDKLACIENQYMKDFLSFIDKEVEIFTPFPVENMFDDFKDNYTDIKDLLYVRPPSGIMSGNT